MSVFSFIEKNQVQITRNFLMALYASEFVGAKYNASSSLHKHSSRFLHLLYAIEKENGKTSYDIGPYDAYYVTYWLVLLLFMRAILMQHVFDPIAKHVLAIKSGKARVRFAEQSWSVVYYTLSFALGSYLYYHSPYYNNIENIFMGWPHDRMSGLFKKYYLISTAFWLQQVVVLHIEQRRKDHYQMLSHHFVTCALVIGSYYYYFNRIGNLILIIMDSVDIFLSAAKILKYSHFTTACDAMFALFTVAWIILRHGVYNYLFYISWFKSEVLMAPSKCGLDTFYLKRCWTPFILNCFLFLLGGLQILSLVWLYMILKVVVNLLRGDNAEDTRSDDNDTDVECSPQVMSKSKEDEVAKGEVEGGEVEKVEESVKMGASEGRK